jgi:hypothetical protein
MIIADRIIWIISSRVEKNVAGYLRGTYSVNDAEAGCRSTGGAVFFWVHNT